MPPSASPARSPRRAPPASPPAPPPPLTFPGADALTPAWARSVAKTLAAASWAPPVETRALVPVDAAIALVNALAAELDGEPTVVDLAPPDHARVVVVGDTHGHFHDVVAMLDLVGEPGPHTRYVFNGDFVDRGAWGLETFLLLAAWRLTARRGGGAAPAAADRAGAVTLLRGNHESATCTAVYGFRRELVVKLGAKDGAALYRACRAAFARLPLAALVGDATLVLHGGLFRAPLGPGPRGRGRGGGGGGGGSSPAARRRRAAAAAAVALGSIADLRMASKGGADPSGRGASRLATDVLWSDPAPDGGVEPNDARGVGLLFGPDATQAFCRANGVRLIIRSHEGPDARDGRDGMAAVLGGYALDHAGPDGALYTVFSAADYPMFAPAGEDRYGNLGAVAVLTAPSFDQPNFVQYAPAPRPPAAPYYDLGECPSDEDVPDGFGEGGGSDLSAGVAIGGGWGAESRKAVRSPSPALAAGSPRRGGGGKRTPSPLALRAAGRGGSASPRRGPQPVAVGAAPPPSASPRKAPAAAAPPASPVVVAGAVKRAAHSPSSPRAAARAKATPPGGGGG